MTAEPVSVTVEEVPGAFTLALRSVVLRGGGPAVLPGDDDPATVHLAARDGDGAVVGVVRIHPEVCPWRPGARRPWQLRGMATAAANRGTGAGRALVEAALEHIRARDGDLVWCNARITAAGFYERMGFVVVTGEFDRPGVGPHVGMLRDLQRSGLVA